MYKKYNGSVDKNKVVQVLGDNTIVNLPLLKAGTHLNKLETNFKRNGYSCKINGDKIVLLADDTLHILKYSKDSIVELKNFKLNTITNIDRWDNVILPICSNKVLIIYRCNEIVNCNVLEVDESRNIYNLGIAINIGAEGSAIRGITACKLQDNRIIVGVNNYKNYPSGVPTPHFLVVKINEDNSVTTLSKIDVFDSLSEDHPISNYGVDTIHLVTIKENTFVLFNNLDNRNIGKAFISTYTINNLNEVKRYDAFQSFKTINANWESNYTPPLFLAENKILYFDEGNAIIIEVKFSDGSCNFNILDSVRVVYDFGEFALGNLSKNDDGTLDILVIHKFSYKVISINKEVTKITIKENEGTTNFYNRRGVIVNLENNKCFYNNNSADGMRCYIATRNESNGNIIGIAKESDIVCVDGLCELTDANLETGKSYYYNFDGALTTTSENNTYIGYSIDTNKIINNPLSLKNKTIIRNYDVYGADKNKIVQVLSTGKIRNIPLTTGKIIGLHVGNGKVVIQGFAKNLDMELISGQKYYFDSEGILTTVIENNTFLGYAVSENTLYIPKYLN